MRNLCKPRARAVQTICIFCKRYCTSAIPTDAITHGHGFELAPYDINAMVYRKEQLLEAWPPSKVAVRTSSGVADIHQAFR